MLKDIFLLNIKMQHMTLANSELKYLTLGNLVGINKTVYEHVRYHYITVDNIAIIHDNVSSEVADMRRSMDELILHPDIALSYTSCSVYI
jgi:hypothetical protein